MHVTKCSDVFLLKSKTNSERRSSWRKLRKTEKLVVLSFQLFMTGAGQVKVC